jgi:hypothetical protein
MTVIDIMAHGGKYGGKSKQKFYKYPDMPVIPLRTKKQVPSTAQGERFFRPPIKFNNRIYGIMTDYSNITMRVLDKDLNTLQTLSVVSYASNWPLYGGFGISKRFSKLFRLYRDSNSYCYIVYHNIDGNGNLDGGTMKLIQTYSSFANQIIIDDDNDKLYFVWGSTLYCYQISTFNTSSTPLWSAGLPWQPWYMELFGNILVISNGNTNYGTRTYTVSGSGITQIAQNQTLYPESFLYDGTYLYFVIGAYVKKYDINLNLLATSMDFVSGTRPLSEKINKVFFATNKLIDGYIHLCTNYSVLIVDSATLSIISEFLFFDPAVTPNYFSNQIDTSGNLYPYMLYDIDNGEAIYTQASQNTFYNGSYTTESKYRVTVSKLKY